MTHPQADVALLTERRYAASTAPDDDWYFANILREARLLQEALDDIGLSSVRVNWADPDVDWSSFRCAVFRTTWDYFDRFSAFTDWLERVQQQTLLCNHPSLIEWNLDKHYLADLHERGVPVVPSRFLEQGSAIDLRALLDDTGWNAGVIKPCISGAARHTYRFDQDNAAEVESTIRPLLASESFLVQPFLQDVVETGEDTLMVFDGTFTHAVRKVAQEGDFRVQDDHGGTVHTYQPTDAQVELAERAMQACTPDPAYGRVDMVRDSDGRWVVMEVEVIEPELWLRHHPPAAQHFARAIADYMSVHYGAVN